MPRPYKSVKRKQLQEELRQRIIEATVSLHAEKGSATTTYKDIAERADVAIPSVYKHFPEQSALLVACTGYAASMAPMPSLKVLTALPKTNQRIEALVEMRCKVNKYFHPWLKWGGDKIVPEIIALIKADTQATKELLEISLAPTYKRKTIPKETMSISLLLLNYHSWARLAIEEKLSQGQIKEYLSVAICRLI